MITSHGNPEIRWTLFDGYLFKYCSVKYQTTHQVIEKTSQQTYSHQKTTRKAFQMPPRAIKRQLTCSIELTSGSFLIGRRRFWSFPGIARTGDATKIKCKHSKSLTPGLFCYKLISSKKLLEVLKGLSFLEVISYKQ